MKFLFTKDVLLHNKSWFLLTGTFLSVLSSFFIIPYYVVYLYQSLGMSVLQVSLLLMLRATLEKGLTLPAGMMADNIGAKKVALLGIALRIIGLILLADTHTFAGLVASSLLNGVGLACGMIASKKAMLELIDSNMKAFASIGLAINMGVAAGPLFGYLMIGYDFAFLCYANAACLVIVAIIYAMTLSNCRSYNTERISPWKWLSMLRQANIRPLFLMQLCFFYFYTFLELVFPLYSSLNISLLASGMTFTINAITVILSNLFIIRRVKTAAIELSYGFLVFSVAFILIAISSLMDFPSQLFFYAAGIFFFSIAEVFFTVMIDAQAIANSPVNTTGTVMGILGLFSMTGVGLGYTLNGILFDYFHSRDIVPWFWGLFIAISGLFFVIALTVSRLCKRERRAR
ncbi:MFS transporter [Dickeya dadantii]|uniref:MFS transporter n=1 Tax=Dickeya dadantii TaxID=204038 RepID=UPI001CF3F1ED|nr:MFS transporter [Dickeya dadantii]MCA7014944.1 MFS transporter [Dickeya dadantii]